jgi:hypothetical protein
MRLLPVYYVDARDEFGFKPEAVPPLEEYVGKNLESTRRAVKAGVKIGMGSDAVYSMFGQNTRELEWLVKAGMTPAQALAAATTTAAELLDEKNRLGRIAPGFAADLVAIEGRPLEQITDVITGVRWVMKDGVVVVNKVGSRQYSSASCFLLPASCFLLPAYFPIGFANSASSTGVLILTRVNFSAVIWFQVV